MARDRDDHDEILNEVKGKGAMVTPWHGFQEGMFGTGRLILTSTRVIDRTKFIVTERNTTIPLHQVQGVSIIATGNPLLLLLGIPTLGIGFILYFFMKKRYLVVTSASTTQVISIKGDMTKYEDFVQDVLDEIDRQRKSGPSKGGSTAPAAAERPAVETSERVAAPAAEAKKTIAVRCPECDAEYRVPANSAGKKFRCQKCQATIEVG
ncbi:MAG: MJ0042-type zinc finger domain-containing protein [Gemmataceae bacterium]